MDGDGEARVRHRSRRDSEESTSSAESTSNREIPEDEHEVEATENNQSKVDVPRHVLVKLILFSLLMLIVPLGIFFASMRYLFKGNVLYGTIFAIVAVNVILFGYVIVAILEEDEDKADIRKKQA